eukprot:CAMPEP_0183710894 /NCGR_PEP_ID=MMETSP0737-20130205/6515_1 /TAXON_ID=385413 /ORGANISM="Thalassiosira miniscula, Strain CCMP1093" /LENGTH=1000 /DNA_ID=CAMNT_0025939263 /DNA_START=179 /DNA_END=3181 /DNA_ORIENTATION=+
MTAANVAANNDGIVNNRYYSRKQSRRRMLITKNEDIADRIRSIIGNKDIHHFDIEAEDDSATITNSSILLHLDKMTPAVTPKTIFNFHPSRQFNQTFVSDLAILAASPGEDQDFTIVSVNMQSGNVRGLQRGRNGETRQLSVGSSKTRSIKDHTLHVRTMSHSARNFTCGVGHKDDEHHHHHDHERGLSIFDDDHKPELHKLISHASQENTQSQSSDKETRNRPAEATSPNNSRHDFIINLAIAVDADFIRRQGNMESAVEYINWLVSGASKIFEEEINAHLNVVRIEETEIFRNVDNLRDGLKTMRLHYEDTISDLDGAHLVHAMLGEHIGGGIAFIDTVCDSKWGVGLSSGLRGSMRNLDDDALQDAFMVAHELGHSLGSGHTFDGYDPPVDTCDGNICPDELPIQNSATIMSYCNFCDGGLDNIALTLGGVWNGAGPRHDINSWDANPYMAKGTTISTDPKRVSHQIWTSLSKKGECIRRQPGLADIGSSSLIDMANPTLIPSTHPITTPTLTPSIVPTNGPTRTPTSNPTTKPTNIPTLNPSTTPTQSPTTNPTKSPTFFPDLPEDGLVWFQPERHCMEERNCFAAPGIMFDLSLNEEQFSNGVLVESMQFEHAHFNATADLYTIEGSHLGREQFSDQWQKVATVGVEEANSHTKIELDTPITIFPGGKQGFYLATPNVVSLFLVGMGPSVSSADSNGVSLEGGSVVFDMFLFNFMGYSPTVQVGYVMADAPTMNPTTSSPTVSPTTTPTLHPTTSSPTLSPSDPPTMHPVTSSPTSTSNPSGGPTASLTTSSPTLSPSIADGPFSIGPEYLCVNDCFVAPGYMFSVQNINLNDSRHITITGISFEHIEPNLNRTVELYSGSPEQDYRQWQKIESLEVPKMQFHLEEFVLHTPIVLSKGEKVGFYLRARESIVLVGKNDNGSFDRNGESSSGDGNAQLFYGNAVMNGRSGAAVFEGYSWNGEVTYSTNTLEAAVQSISNHTRYHQYTSMEKRNLFK